MATWTIDEPRKLTFDTVRRLRVRTVAGSVGLVASAFDELHREGQPALRSIRGRLGAGTGRLQASTTSGHAALLRREPEARESR